MQRYQNQQQSQCDENAIFLDQFGFCVCDEGYRMFVEVGTCLEEEEKDEESSAESQESGVRLAAQIINYTTVSICIILLIVAVYKLWNLLPICDPIELTERVLI